MKIQYISDIHLELTSKSINIIPIADVLILAGDIGNPYEEKYYNFLLDITSKFKKTFIIAGNHEYYKHNIIDVKSKIKDICNKLSNITFLDNSFEDYNNYRFIGTTLWSKITNTFYTINDITEINNMTIEKYNLLHNECLQFLNEILSNSIDKKVIVITHHLPIYELTHIKYINNFYYKYHEWFNADIDDIITRFTNISAFIYGHTHIGSIQRFYNVNFYCNPLGYENENEDTDINKFFEL